MNPEVDMIKAIREVGRTPVQRTRFTNPSACWKTQPLLMKLNRHWVNPKCWKTIWQQRNRAKSETMKTLEAFTEEAKTGYENLRKQALGGVKRWVYATMGIYRFDPVPDEAIGWSRGRVVKDEANASSNQIRI